jgi:hypothetical protein
MRQWSIPDSEFLAMVDKPYVTGGDPRQVLDLYLPDQAHGPVPAVLWIHGGAWEYGSKHPCPVRNFAGRGYADTLLHSSAPPAGSATLMLAIIAINRVRCNVWSIGSGLPIF